MANDTIAVLSILTQGLPIGTNLAMLHFMFMLVSGALLPSRGAMFPGLKLIGLSDAATRRAWVAFRKGVWQMPAILVLWREHVKKLPGWQERRYEGYRPIPADVTAFWRPTLKNCPSKHYHPAANRALPVAVRLATNFTAHRNFLPEHFKGRKPTYGDLVRPLPRKHKGKTLAATAPDETYTWVENGHELRAEIWRDLVLNKIEPNENNKTFDVYAIYDPAFDAPWLLAVPLKLKPESVRGIYKDRWPVKQIPNSAKQMVGSHRQFVHNTESIQRLPELALLAGSILSFLTASFPPTPTGFWDRKPKRTPGRFRRLLIGKPFPKDAPISGQLREKKSVTAHLPKGNLARQPKPASIAPV